MSSSFKKFAWLMAVVFLLGMVGSALAQQEEKVLCAVCGKEMKKSEAKITYEYKGQTYYFASEKCKEKFVKEPETFLKMEKKEGCAGMAMAKDMVKCPVSGKMMKKADAKVSAEYKDQTYYFCCEKSKEAFLKEPDQYLKTVYTCTMCKDVKSDKPGKCPKCGMELQAKTMAKNCCQQTEVKKEAGKEASGGCPMHNEGDCPMPCAGKK